MLTNCSVVMDCNERFCSDLVGVKLCTIIRFSFNGERVGMTTYVLCMLSL